MAKKTKWEVALLKVDQLIESSNGNLFDRATLLVQVWDDPEFLAFHDGEVDKAEAHLDGKLGDYGIGFFNVMTMLEYFPDRSKWEAGKLREMLAYALEQEEAKRERTAETPVVRKGPIPRKEHEQLQRHAASLEKVQETMQAEVERLRSENASLRRELDRAEGRIAELERLVNRQVAVR